MNHDLPTDDDAPTLGSLPPPEPAELYEQARRAGAETTQIEALDLAALRAAATAEGLEVRPGLGRQELQFLLLQARCSKVGMALGSGILEVAPDGFGFLRSARSDFRAGPGDIYLSPSQVHRLNLKTGQRISGPLRLPRRGEQYFALLRVEEVDGGTVADLRARVPFDQAVPVLPRRRLPLQHPRSSTAVRAIEQLSPWGRGQRVLMQAPPGCGRTRLLLELVDAALAANPDLHGVVCLLDERPEDVSEFRAGIAARERCTVVATTFDEAPQRHVAVADLVLARCQRLVEAGQHVLLALDSLTALVRASHHDAPPTGRILTPGLDAQALLRSKRLFAAARSLEGGSSLTVIATVLTGTESRIDQIVAEEFAGKGNAEIVLDRELAAQHVFPALDVLRTGTRREDLLLAADEIGRLRRLREELAALPAPDRLAALLGRDRSR